MILRIDGIPSSWYTMEPRLLPILNPGVSKTFVINLLVPEGTEAKQYYGTINATSNETYDEKLTSVIVFGSREELVRYQLKKLKDAFEDFKEDVAVEEFINKPIKSDRLVQLIRNYIE